MPRRSLLMQDIEAVLQNPNGAAEYHRTLDEERLLDLRRSLAKAALAVKAATRANRDDPTYTEGWAHVKSTARSSTRAKDAARNPRQAMERALSDVQHKLTQLKSD